MALPVWQPMMIPGALIPQGGVPKLEGNPAGPEKSPVAQLEQGIQDLEKLLVKAKSGSALDFRDVQNAYEKLLKTESKLWQSGEYKALNPDDKKKFKEMSDLIRENLYRPIRDWQRVQRDLSETPPTDPNALAKYKKDRAYYLEEEAQIKDKMIDLIRTKGQTPDKLFEADIKRLEADFEKTSSTELKPLQDELDKARKELRDVELQEYATEKSIAEKKAKYQETEGFIQKPLKELDDQYEAFVRRNPGKGDWTQSRKDHRERRQKLEAELRAKYDPEHSEMKRSIELLEPSLVEIRHTKAEKALVVKQKELAVAKKKDVLSLPLQELRLNYQKLLLEQEKQSLIRRGIIGSDGKYTGKDDGYQAWVDYSKKSADILFENERLQKMRKGQYIAPSGVAGLEAQVEASKKEIDTKNEATVKIQQQQKALYDKFNPLQDFPEGFNINITGSTLSLKDICTLLNANRGEANLLGLWQPGGIKPEHLDEALKRLKEPDYLVAVLKSKGFPPDVIEAAKTDLTKQSKALITTVEAMKKDFKVFDADGDGVITLKDAPIFSKNNLSAIKSKIASLNDDELEQLSKAIGRSKGAIKALNLDVIGAANKEITTNLTQKTEELFRNYMGIER
ncbi:MAG: hypothetical protein K2X66_07355 [Cyanobacteria bacterium]|nr:hypothetical protein [Cyanobacteriota bacterium]